MKLQLIGLLVILSSAAQATPTLSVSLGDNPRQTLTFELKKIRRTNVFSLTDSIDGKIVGQTALPSALYLRLIVKFHKILPKPGRSIATAACGDLLAIKSGAGKYSFVCLERTHRSVQFAVAEWWTKVRSYAEPGARLK